MSLKKSETFHYRFQRILVDILVVFQLVNHRLHT